MIAPWPSEMVRALFRIDLLLKEEVDGGDDEVGNDVKGSNTQENIGVIKWHLFRHLHHAKNNHQIGAVEDMALEVLLFRAPGAVQLENWRMINLHLWAQTHTEDSEKQ